MSKFFIYTIHNIINNKIYIGKSINPYKRWIKHIATSNGKKSKKFYIHKAIFKYGINSFVFSILQELSNEKDLDIAEMYWIKYFKSNDNKFGYNLTNGGEGCSGRKLSDETKNKIRLKAIGRKHSKETKEKLRLINLNKIPVNIEQIREIAKSKKGTKLSKEHCLKISKSKLGVKFTDEHKLNISLSQIGLHCGNKNNFYGKKHTQETIIKSSGENNIHSKLKDFQVIEIREKYSTREYEQDILAKEYGVSIRTISNIINRIAWKHIK